MVTDSELFDRLSAHSPASISVYPRPSPARKERLLQTPGGSSARQTRGTDVPPWRPAWLLGRAKVLSAKLVEEIRKHCTGMTYVKSDRRFYKEGYREVMRLHGQGLTTKEIAERVHLCPRRVLQIVKAERERLQPTGHKGKPPRQSRCALQIEAVISRWQVPVAGGRGGSAYFPSAPFCRSSHACHSRQRRSRLTWSHVVPSST